MVYVRFFALLVLVLFSQCTHSKVVEVHQLYITMSQNDWTTMNNNPNNELEYSCEVSLMNSKHTGVGIQIHGASSRSYSKKSFKIDFKDNPPTVNLFNYPGDRDEELKSVILNAAWVDSTFLRNKLSADLTRELGGKAPRIVYAEVYVNNNYYGFYLLMEKIGKPFFKSQGWSKDGNLYKAISHDSNFQMKSNPLLGYEKKNNEEGPSNDIGNLLSTLDKTPKTFADWEKSVSPIFSIRDWFVYCFVHVYSNDFDGFDKNYYLYHDLSHSFPFRVILWDSDASWGHTWTGYPEAMTSELWHSDGMSTRLFSISEYVESYLSNFKCLINSGLLSTSQLYKRIDNLAADISPYVAKDETIWLSSRTDHRNFNLEVTDIKNWIAQRSPFFLKQIDDKISSMKFGTTLKDYLVSSSGTKYFKCGVMLDATSPSIVPSNKIIWKCLSSFTCPIGLTSSGDPACMSLNGRDCLWSDSCQSVLSQYSTSTNLQPLVCGAGHLAVHGITGYESSDHWCSISKNLLNKNSAVGDNGNSLSESSPSAGSIAKFVFAVGLGVVLLVFLIISIFLNRRKRQVEKV